MRMLWIADSDLELAVLRLDHARNPPPWTALTTLEKMELLNDVLLQVDAVDVDAWTDTSQAQHLAPMSHLWKLLTECRVAKWVTDINRSRGVAPSSSLVYDQWMRFAEGLPQHIKLRLLRLRSSNARKLWAVRWRRRWGGAMGTLPLADVDDADVFLHKARSPASRVSALPARAECSTCVV